MQHHILRPAPICALQAVRARIAAAPRHWLIAAQTFRLGVEYVLHMEYVRGRAPIQV